MSFSKTPKILLKKSKVKNFIRIKEDELSRYLNSQIEIKPSVFSELNEKLSKTRLEIKVLDDKIKTYHTNKSDETKTENDLKENKSQKEERAIVTKKTVKELNANEESTMLNIKKKLKYHGDKEKVR